MLVRLVAAAFFGATAAAAAAPTSVELSYDVARNGLHIGVTSERFEAGDSAYRVVSETRAVGPAALFLRRPRTLASSGQLTGAGLRPLRFDDARGDDDARRMSASFDWKRAQLTLVHDGKSEIVPLPAGTQDRLSIMYQFMYTRPGQRAHVEFPMTNGRKLDRYRYSVARNVEIETALGRLDTVHLVKERNPDESGTELWLAPQYHYLPVKVVVIEEDGTRYEQTLTRIDTRP